MDRKEFLKHCACGLCSCAAVGLLEPTSSAGAETEAETPAEPPEDWRFGFVKKRHAKLLDILAGKLTEEELTETLRQLGSFCASTSQLVQRHKGDIDGYMSEFKQLSGDDISYDRQAGIVTVTGVERGECFCPLVDAKLISKTMCDCSLGWQQYAFETVLGKKVRVQLKESILRGSKRCSFEIRVLDETV